MNHNDYNKAKPQTYAGDLEADYLKFLTKVQKSAKENPVDVEFDFPQGLPAKAGAARMSTKRGIVT
jgi:hypothetical protein